MATQAQIDALKEALYSGELRVRYADKEVLYRSVAEIRLALSIAESELAGEDGVPVRRKVHVTDAPRQKGWSR